MIELAGIIVLGILAQWVAWRLKIPAILPLILIGLLVGPIAAEFITDDGAKWIEPIWNDTKGLFPGDGLYYFVSLAISIILFEGGLTLKLKEINNVGPVITKLITLGALITFILSAIAAYYLFHLSWELSFLFSGLIIVTGPTVISPILRNIPLKRDLSAVLKWEGILIDPIGALVAVLVYEFISVGGDSGFTQTALMEFLKILLFGTTFGFTFAHGLAFVTKRKWIPHYLLNVVSLSMVLLVFVLSDAFAHESGLLAVVVMGMVLGNSNLENLKELLYFKESLSVLLISILFILLAANINYSDLELLFNWNTLILFLLVVFIVRPLSVFACTYKSNLRTNERLFISWVGPRGIVAAGIASLFGTKLIKQGVAGAEYITPLVFMIVLGTVLLNATTARFFAKISGVFLTKSEGILIIGASKLSRIIGKYLEHNGRNVFLIDSNENNIKEAKTEGLEGLATNIYSDSVFNKIDLNDIGYVMALTGNSKINTYAIKKFGEQYGENGSYRLVSEAELTDNKNNLEKGLFSHTDDYTTLMQVAQQYPTIQEATIHNTQDYLKAIKLINNEKLTVPLFIKNDKGELKLIPEFNSKEDVIKEKSKLVYLGKLIQENQDD